METNTSAAQINGVPVGASSPITSIQVANAADTATSGITTLNKVQTTITPSAPSTHTGIGLEVAQTVSGSQPGNTGGYGNSFLASQVVSATATIDKNVVAFAKLDYTAANTNSFGIIYESALASVNAGATVSLLAHYLVPNHANVVGYTTRITQRFAFLCQDVNTPSMLDRIIDPDYNEITPPLAIGVQSGQMYSADITAYSGTGVVANKVYITFVHVPVRCTIASLALEVTVGGAGNGRIAIFKVGGGQLGAKVAEGAEFSTAVAALKSVPINTQVNAGTYAICSVFSAAAHQIRYHTTPASNARVIGRSAIGNVSEEAFITMAYGAFPSTFAGTALSRTSSGIEADMVWIPA